MTNINAAESAARSAHTLAIDRRRRASVTGVTDVCSFHETEVVLKIDSGMMILTGQGLHIAKLLLEDGRLEVDGHIDGVIYETPKAAAKRAFSWKWLKNAVFRNGRAGAGVFGGGAPGTCAGGLPGRIRAGGTAAPGGGCTDDADRRRRADGDDASRTR